jgi:integrase/recombinase XerD
MNVFIRRRRDAGRQDKVILDRRGYRRPPVTLPGHNAGQHPPNYGRTFPAEVLSPAEIRRLIVACGRGRGGMRNRALIVVLWRGGLRCQEALDLELRDVDREAGTVTIRHGKGNRRRVVGLDPPAFAVLEQWLEHRATIGVPRGSKIFCTITRPNVGDPMGGSYWREAIKKLGVRAGIEKRVHSHGLRHTLAVELMREGVPLLVIQRQLGHSSLQITERYVNHLEPGELIDVMRARTWPHQDEPPLAA